MLRKPGRSSLLRRIEDLEGRLTDESCVAPNSPEWLAYWDRQVYYYMIGQPHAPFTIAAFRAIWFHYSDDPASLVGKHCAETPDEDEL
jgi:hypothetical protein